MKRARTWGEGGCGDGKTDRQRVFEWERKMRRKEDWLDDKDQRGVTRSIYVCVCV
jgi:hypothetical protein